MKNNVSPTDNCVYKQWIDITQNASGYDRMTTSGFCCKHTVKHTILRMMWLKNC